VGCLSESVGKGVTVLTINISLDCLELEGEAFPQQSVYELCLCSQEQQLLSWYNFLQLGLNEADTIQSSSILISRSNNRIFIHTSGGMMPELIK